MGYLAIKHAHIGLAFATLLLFASRGLYRLLMAPTAAGVIQKSLNYVSYGVDIFLLVLGLYLLSVWAGTDASLVWVGSKLVFLALYIVVGVLAYRPILSVHYRWLCFALALFFWVLMYKTAKLKLPFWQWFG